MNQDQTQAVSKADSWRMFDYISPRYDLLNRVLSLGLDQGWRRKLNLFIGAQANQEVLDLATGTGDVLLALSRHSNVKTGVGVDLSDRMLAVGEAKIQRRELDCRLRLQAADIQHLPFADASFDAATMAFGIRNVPDPRKVLREMFRVLKTGGRALILEFSLPSSWWFRFLYLFYLRKIVPAVGSLVSGHPEAYRYLNLTIEEFPCGRDFCVLMQENGFQRVEAHPMTFGIATIYQGGK